MSTNLKNINPFTTVELAARGWGTLWTNAFSAPGVQPRFGQDPFDLYAAYAGNTDGTPKIRRGSRLTVPLYAARVGEFSGGSPLDDAGILSALEGNGFWRCNEDVALVLATTHTIPGLEVVVFSQRNEGTLGKWYPKIWYPFRHGDQPMVQAEYREFLEAEQLIVFHKRLRGF